MTAPLALYMPRAQAILLRIGDSAIELSVARVDDFAAFLRRWSVATVTIGNDTGRVVIASGTGTAVADAIDRALATRARAIALLEAA